LFTTQPTNQPTAQHRLEQKKQRNNALINSSCGERIKQNKTKRKKNSSEKSKPKAVMTRQQERDL